MKYLSIMFISCLALTLVSCSSSRSVSKARGHSINTKSRQVVHEAQKQIGSRYKYGGSTPKGFDCSGLVCYVYDKARIELPRVSSQQARIGKKISLKELNPGDLVFFGNGKVNHVGIVQKASKKQLVMIHSSSSKGVVQQEIYSSPYWSKRVLFGRRILN